MLRPKWLCNFIAHVDYGIALPLIARLPPGTAKWFVRLRGIVNFVFDLEWRTLALRHGYVRGATVRTMRAISELTQSQSSPWLLTLRRFVRASWEEYDAQRLCRIDYKNVAWHDHGLDKILDTVQSGKGVVLLTGHFDSLYVGLMILARQGVRVNLMSSNIVDDPRVPAMISGHFGRKISAMARQFYPGKVIHFEDGMKHFVDVLKRGEVLVIACDGPPPTAGRGSVVRFLGGDYTMAIGPEFFARKTGALISMYSCVREADEQFRIDFSEPIAVDDDGLQLAFNVLDAKIRAEPWRWWAADMYQNYHVASESEKVAVSKH